VRFTVAASMNFVNSACIRSSDVAMASLDRGMVHVKTFDLTGRVATVTAPLGAFVLTKEFVIL
jgi:hypothetical protein